MSEVGDREARPMDHARVAALWITHGRACAKLLRAHRRTDHAENFEAALAALVEIVAAEVGSAELSQALDWAAHAVWGGTGSAQSVDRH